MSKRIRRGAVALFVSTLLPAVAGVADANTVPVENDTIDGYHLTISIDNFAIQSVPNMAAAPFVREGFITATSTLKVVCNEDKCLDTPMTAALTMSAQVGCPMDISNGFKPIIEPSVGASVPVGGILRAILPPPTPSDVTDIALAPVLTGQPQVQVNVFPGYIRDVNLGMIKFPLGDNERGDNLIGRLNRSISIADSAQELDPSLQSGPKTRALRQAADVLKTAVNLNDKPLMVSVQNFHLEVDNTENNLAVCGGVVAIRIYAQGKIQTARSVDTVDIYGDIVTL